jgi:hypothetical protein
MQESCADMFAELDNWMPTISHAPASAAVYQCVRLRMRNLRGLRKFGQEHDNPRSALSMTPEAIRSLELQHLPRPALTSRFSLMTDKEVEEEAIAAGKWLFGMLDCHDRTLDREQQMRLFRAAVEKQMADQKERWTEMETLYMALTDYQLKSTEERLRAALGVVLLLNLAENLQDVSKLAAVRTDRIHRATTMDDELDDIRDTFVERTRSIRVDHFACAIPLSLLTTTANNVSVVDDNAGCCPICQNSYTALSTKPPGESLQATSSEGFQVEDLLADFPVRIKHCGHIVGKACLERWMSTPKIDEAKYPHRTCPLCRVKIEGVKTPEVPQALLKHLREDRRALETVRELMYGYDIELSECLDLTVACMSEEIACKELLAELGRSKTAMGGGVNGQLYVREEKVFSDKLAELRKEKWAWGFRGDGIWGQLRDEWMDSGVLRRA